MTVLLFAAPFAKAQDKAVAYKLPAYEKFVLKNGPSSAGGVGSSPSGSSGVRSKRSAAGAIAARLSIVRMATGIGKTASAFNNSLRVSFIGISLGYEKIVRFSFVCNYSE